MAHCVQAIIAVPSVLARVRARELGLDHPPIPLDAGLAWVPASAATLDRIEESSTLARGPGDDRFEQLHGTLPAILIELSRSGRRAYVETEYWAGEGQQHATVFDRGERVLAHGTVNEALRAIGVRARAQLDEWDAVGLAGHRSIDAGRVAR